MKPIEYADKLGKEYSLVTSKEYKKDKGQFFTPIEVARFMASLISTPKSDFVKILDPGVGTGILTCALLERLVSKGVTNVYIECYETDSSILEYTNQSLKYLRSWGAKHSVKIEYEIISKDFILEVLGRFESVKKFDVIISNPPYFKLPKSDDRVKLLQKKVKVQPNIYSIFMILSSDILKEGGELVFITPRSFASGLYFKTFREYFFEKISIERLHLFESRKKAFKRDKVLQETIILKGSKAKSDEAVISSSNGIDDLKDCEKYHYSQSEILNLNSDAKILFLPSSKADKQTIEIFNSWSNRLEDFDIKVSTGPVVSFRNREHLSENAKKGENVCPMIWLNNVATMKLNWPISSRKKAQWIKINDESLKVLLPVKNYILLRRFSSKDDNKRLIATPLYAKDVASPYIGVENKLNYLYMDNEVMDEDLMIGVGSLLNSNLYDTYFRTFNGNVNVSATEIRFLTFPSLSLIRLLGAEVLNSNNFEDDHLDELVDKIILKSYINGENRRSQEDFKSFRHALQAT